MTEKFEIYKCEICENIVEVVFEGAGELVCCGQPMLLMTEHTANEEMLAEKHVPVVEKTEDGIEIKIGSIPHPMENEHYIMMIEAFSEDGRYIKRKYLNPNDEAKLSVKCNCDEKVIAREFCNIHGLWSNK